MDVEKNEAAETGKSLTGSAWSIIDRVSDLDWTLRIASIVLYVDSVMMCLSGNNILSLNWSPNEWGSHLGAGIVALLSYSMCVAFLFPLVEAGLEYVIRHIWFVWMRGVRKNSALDSYSGYVTEWALEQAADEEQSMYLLAKVEKSVKNAEKLRQKNRKLGSLAFAVLAFLVIDTYVQKFGAEPTLVGLLLIKVRTRWETLISILVVGALLLICLSSWTIDRWKTRWIRCEPIYNRQKQERLNKEK